MLFSSYAVLQAGIGLVFLAMVHHVSKAKLVSPRAPSDLTVTTDRRAIGLLTGFTTSIPVLFLTQYGWVLWIVMPLAVERGLRRISKVIG